MMQMVGGGGETSGKRYEEIEVVLTFDKSIGGFDEDYCEIIKSDFVQDPKITYIQLLDSPTYPQTNYIKPISITPSSFNGYEIDPPALRLNYELVDRNNLTVVDGERLDFKTVVLTYYFPFSSNEFSTTGEYFEFIENFPNITVKLNLNYEWFTD
jgi:hypothetical protein